MSKIWKEAERRIARLLGGQRVPITGRARGSSPDIDHDKYSIEVKHRESYPDWLMEAFEQADMARKVSGDNEKISLVILHEKGQPYTDCLTLMRLRDMIALEERISELENKVEQLTEIAVLYQGG